MYIGCSPLFTGSDEQNHYYRIYEITDGKLVTPVHDNNAIGSRLPVSLYKVFTNNVSDVYNRNKYIKYKDEFEMLKVRENYTKKTEYGNKYETEYNNTSLYSPIQYLPQIIGFSIGRMLKFNPFWLGEMGRLFNLLCYVLICTFFLYKLPRFKVLACLVLLSPNILSNATTLASDGFTCALIFGFITLIIDNIYNKKLISINNLMLLLILSIFISTCKIVYFPFVLLLFLIPKENFTNNKNKYLFIILCIILAILVGATWLNITNRYFDAYYVNSSTQKIHILTNPLKYLLTVLNTYFVQFDNLLLNVFAGNNMYHSQLQVYSILSYAYLILVVLSFFVKEKNKKMEKINISWKQYLFVILIMLLVFALITTAIYIQCTANFVKIDNPVVIGLQGRYYIPLVLCVLLIGYKYNFKFKINNYIYLIDVCLLLNMFILSQMLVQFLI